MKLITTEEEFKRVIKSDKTMVFIWFGWSSQARQSEKVVIEWEEEWLLKGIKLKIEVYKLEPDNYPFTYDWLGDEVKEKGGYGSLVWIKNASIAHYEKYAAKIGVEEITRLTKLVFDV